MIQARLVQDPEGNLVACSVHGHADYDDEGHDIVCAAVSVLTANCINSLEAVVHIRPVIRQNESGVLSFTLPGGLDPRSMQDAQILMKSLRQGLSDVVREYPHFVKLAISNGGKIQ
jgi:hypothetical protein